MMKLNNISLHNFASFRENQVLDLSPFSTDDALLLVGENRDSEGANSNGSGKSSLLHALPWALLGQIPNKASVDDVIRKGTDACFVEVTFELRGRSYTVRRGRGSSKKSNFLSWGPSGVAPLEFSTTTDAQRALLKELGFHPQFAFVDFLNSAYFSVEAMAAFASKSGSSEERMTLLSRFLGLDVLDVARGFARIEKNQYSGRITELESMIARLQEEISAIDSKDNTNQLQQLKQQQSIAEEQIEKLRIAIQASATNEQHIRDTEKINDQLQHLDEKYGSIKKVLQEQIHQHQALCGTLLQEVKNMDKQIAEVDLTIDLEELETAMHEVDTRVTDLREDTYSIESIISRITKTIQQLTSTEQGVLECPHCQGKLLLEKDTIVAWDKQKVVENIEGMQYESNKQAGRLQKKKDQIAELLSIKKEIAAEHTKGQQALQLGEKKQSTLLQMKRADENIVTAEQQLQKTDEDKNKEKTALTQKLEEHQQKIQPLPSVASLQEQRDEVLQSLAPLSRQLAEIESTIKTYQLKQASLTDYKKQHADIREIFEISSFWDGGFSTIRRWRIDQFLPRFEHTTNEFLRLMKTESRITLDTTRQKKKAKDGEDAARAAFTVTVTDGQGVARNIETFSSGESRRIGIACGFALRELTLKQGTNQLEFLLLDEVIDNLDASGIEEFITLLPHIHGLKLVVSHDQALQSHFNHVINVIKENGSTRIE